jgi:hypothetical protein
LLIKVTSVNTPATIGRVKFPPPSDHYWIVAEMTYRNVGHEAVCATITGSLKAEFGIRVSDGEWGQLATGTPFYGDIKDLLPGEEIHRSLTFSLKRGANPQELTVEAVWYGGCGSLSPSSAVRTAVFPIRPVRAAPSPAPR